MLTLQSGQKTTVTLQLGEALTVFGTGTGSVVQLVSGGEPGTPVPFIGTLLAFGPYARPATFRIHCSTGSINYQQADIEGATQDLATALAGLGIATSANVQNIVQQYIAQALPSQVQTALAGAGVLGTN